MIKIILIFQVKKINIFFRKITIKKIINNIKKAVIIVNFKIKITRLKKINNHTKKMIIMIMRMKKILLKTMNY